MGNNPSHPTHSHSRSIPPNSAPPTPTGSNHTSHQPTHNHNHIINNNNNNLNNNLNNINNINNINNQSNKHSIFIQSTSSQLIPLPPLSSTLVDAGYLLPLSNIYPSSLQDWLHPIVQHLILARRLAPFYRGLEDWDPAWQKPTISQALSTISLARANAIRQIHRAERAERDDASDLHKHSPASIAKRFSKPLLDASNPHHTLTHPDSLQIPRHQVFDAILNWPLRPNEADRYLGQTVECPICFLYYPPNINRSRCCHQPICTECFVQIKRSDPTPQDLKSEPACCPYCVETNFGVTYEPPPMDQRTDWQSTTSATSPPVALLPDEPQHSQSIGSSQSAPNPSGLPTRAAAEPEPDLPPPPKRRQTTSHTSQDVVTTDAVQPDWQAKLEAVRAAVQRRANRRIIFRQEGDRLVPVGITSSRDPNGSAFLAALEQEHAPGSTSRRGLGALISSHVHGSSGAQPSGSSRRSRTENGGYGVDLEELMVMEAMRLSLAEEEERKRKAAAEEAKLQTITDAISDACQPGEPSTSSSGGQTERGVSPERPAALRITTDEFGTLTPACPQSAVAVTHLTDEPSKQHSPPLLDSSHHDRHDDQAQDRDSVGGLEPPRVVSSQ